MGHAGCTRRTHTRRPAHRSQSARRSRTGDRAVPRTNRRWHDTRFPGGPLSAVVQRRSARSNVLAVTHIVAFTIDRAFIDRQSRARRRHPRPADTLPPCAAMPATDVGCPHVDRSRAKRLGVFSNREDVQSCFAGITTLGCRLQAPGLGAVVLRAAHAPAMLWSTRMRVAE